MEPTLPHERYSRRSGSSVRASGRRLRRPKWRFRQPRSARQFSLAGLSASSAGRKEAGGERKGPYRTISDGADGVHIVGRDMDEVPWRDLALFRADLHQCVAFQNIVEFVSIVP